MSCTISEMTIGTLLHDIGKLLQRAYGSINHLTWKTYDMESTLCPKGEYQNYTHRHVLFTNAFFDLMQQEQIKLPFGNNFERIAQIASFHHRPEFSPDPPSAWICALADRCSAGMDRKADDEDRVDGKAKYAYRHTPLQSIFDSILLRPDGPMPEKHAYRMQVLDPYDGQALIPAPWQGHVADLPEDYYKLWTGFWQEFKNSVAVPDLTNRLFEESLLGLIEHYTWAIPSSTIDLPDISLFDHLRTSAAIAACLLRFHQERGEENDLSAIKDENLTKFRFLSGDLSGLQNTLFTLESQGVKGVSKILRARSFMLGAIAESAAIQIAGAFGLPSCCIVQQAGGRFLVLVPEISDAEEILNKLRNQFDQWLLEKYTGSLAIHLSLSPPFEAGKFKQGRFLSVFADISTCAERIKQEPLGTCSQGVIKQKFPFNRACTACGVRPAQTVKDDEYRCSTCQQEFELGQRLLKSDLMIWCRRSSDQAGLTDVLSLDLILAKEKDLPKNLQGILSIRDIRPEVKNKGWASRLLANYIPRFPDEYSARDPRYDKIAGKSVEPYKSLTKTFAHIACESLELNEDGTYIGKPFLGLLKADVDYMGAVFSIGLRRQDPQQDRFTLSRMAQLSRMIDLYFTGYLQGIIRRSFPNTYTIYAGGDDLLLIGPWRQMLDLANAVSDSFAEYTGRNPHMGISAGLSLLGAHHPINRAVKETNDLLQAAKTPPKNKIGVFGSNRPMEWPQFKTCLENAEWIHRQMQGKDAVTTGFVYRILQLTTDAEAVASGNVKKANWLARLAYHLARNLKGKNEHERKQKRAMWLGRLKLDQLLNATAKGTELRDWRLPLWIALYRNRS